jgi:hypothetical protein
MQAPLNIAASIGWACFLVVSETLICLFVSVPLFGEGWRPVVCFVVHFDTDSEFLWLGWSEDEVDSLGPCVLLPFILQVRWALCPVINLAIFCGGSNGAAPRVQCHVYEAATPGLRGNAGCGECAARDVSPSATPHSPEALWSARNLLTFMRLRRTAGNIFLPFLCTAWSSRARGTQVGGRCTESIYGTRVSSLW